LETARLWPAIGHFTAEDRFEITCVTGPDEYSALVDNNTYTNLMAAAHLRYLEDVLRRYEQRDPQGWQHFSRRFGPSVKERETFARIARSIHVPRIEDADIPAQDSRFAMRRPWPRERTARPLLLHYHPLEIYRHRIIKQADVLLAMVLRREPFDRCEMARALRYYGPLTTHDSSLSPAPHAIIASWTGEWEAARAYFADSAFVDLENRHANSGDGLHFASLAGAWRVISEGFAGFDPLASTASFRPRLPPWLEGYSFRLRREGRLIEIAVTPAGVCYRLIAGAPIDIRHDGRRHHLTSGAGLRLALAGEEG
ncbi:MAG: glycoside hydrolase family 65 protein, partial [Alphaproteobacteria bacterium]